MLEELKQGPCGDVVTDPDTGVTYVCTRSKGHTKSRYREMHHHALVQDGELKQWWDDDGVLLTHWDEPENVSGPERVAREALREVSIVHVWTETDLEDAARLVVDRLRAAGMLVE